MKYIVSALLLAGQTTASYVFSEPPVLNPDGYDSCSVCILKGGIWAAATKHIEPFYHHPTDAPYADTSINEVVMNAGGDSPVYCTDEADDLEEPYQLSSIIEQWQTTDFEDQNVAIMACPYVENRCGE